MPVTNENLALGKDPDQLPLLPQLGKPERDAPRVSLDEMLFRRVHRRILDPGIHGSHFSSAIDHRSSRTAGFVPSGLDR